MKTTAKTIGERIRTRRETLNLKQHEMADRLGIERPSYTRYESGDRQISIEDLPSLAAILGVPIGYFYGDEDAAYSDSWDAVLNESAREAGFDGADTSDIDREEWREVVKSVTAGMVRANRKKKSIQ